ncbi:MAG: replication initiation factor domain-containing protein [Coprobacillaceae bacterium]
MAKRNNLSVKIDYLSMVFETITAEDLVRKFLHLPFEYFSIRNSGVKHKRYTKLYEFGSIRIFGDAKRDETNMNGVGCYLVLAGQGCNELNDFFDSSVEKINSNGLVSFLNYCNKQLEVGSYHLTRIDIAIDDRNEKPYFTIEQLYKKCLNDEIISCCRSYRFNESKFEENGTAKTLYVGDGKSSISFRFYDKDKEMCQKHNIPNEDMESWKRSEIQLRDDRAHSFALLMIDEFDRLGELAFELLASSLKFVVKDKNQSNKSRWKTCEFWKRFSGAVKPLKMKTYSPVNRLKDTENWLQYGGALSAIRLFSFLEHHNALGELKNLEVMLNKVYYSPTLYNKAVVHLKENGLEELIPLVYRDTKTIPTK